MDVLEKALQMLDKYPLCDHCLGRQFALLGHGLENNRRGEALKLALTLQNSAIAMEKKPEGVRALKVLAVNGFSNLAQATLKHLKKRLPKAEPKQCFLCSGHFQQADALTAQVMHRLQPYEYATFLMGIEIPVAVAEREDEFKACFNVGYSESVKHEFGRVLGKKVEALSRWLCWLSPGLRPLPSSSPCKSRSSASCRTCTTRCRLLPRLSLPRYLCRDSYSISLHLSVSCVVKRKRT